MGDGTFGVDSDGVLTLRRLTVTVLAASLGLTLVGPARADQPALTSLIVTFAAPPSAYQVDVLRGVTEAVHGFTEIPAAVVVAPAAAATLSNPM